MDKYVELARNTIDRFIRENEVYDPSGDELPDERRLG